MSKHESCFWSEYYEYIPTQDYAHIFPSTLEQRTFAFVRSEAAWKSIEEVAAKLCAAVYSSHYSHSHDLHFPPLTSGCSTLFYRDSVAWIRENIHARVTDPHSHLGLLLANIWIYSNRVYRIHCEYSHTFATYTCRTLSYIDIFFVSHSAMNIWEKVKVWCNLI